MLYALVFFSLYAFVDTSRPTSSRVAEPASAIAKLFPPQGGWNKGAYLSFTESLSRLVELVDGSIEVPATPTKTQPRFVHALLTLLLQSLRACRAENVVAAPYRMRLREGTFREPDFVVCTAPYLDRFGAPYGKPADFVMEVVSDAAVSRVRDYEDKRGDEAAAGVPEY